MIIDFKFPTFFLFPVWSSFCFIIVYLLLFVLLNLYMFLSFLICQLPRFYRQFVLDSRIRVPFHRVSLNLILTTPLILCLRTLSNSNEKKKRMLKIQWRNKKVSQNIKCPKFGKVNGKFHCHWNSIVGIIHSLANIFIHLHTRRNYKKQGLF